VTNKDNLIVLNHLLLV